MESTVRTILLVEDSRFWRLLNERALVKAGYTVATAGDGEEALRLAFERPPDLILLDMLLPKLGGPQVIQALRKSSVTSEIPIVVLSSLPQSNEARLKKEGATAYFDKTALNLHENSDSLIQVVKTVLGDDAPSRSEASISGETDLSHSSKGEA